MERRYPRKIRPEIVYGYGTQRVAIPDQWRSPASLLDIAKSHLSRLMLFWLAFGIAHCRLRHQRVKSRITV